MTPFVHDFDHTISSHHGSMPGAGALLNFNRVMVVCTRVYTVSLQGGKHAGMPFEELCKTPEAIHFVLDSLTATGEGVVEPCDIIHTGHHSPA